MPDGDLIFTLQNGTEVDEDCFDLFSDEPFIVRQKDTPVIQREIDHVSNTSYADSLRYMKLSFDSWRLIYTVIS